MFLLEKTIIPIGLIVTIFFALLVYIARYLEKSKRKTYDAADKRPITLYLRSFDTDKIVDQSAKNIPSLPTEYFGHENLLKSTYKLDHISQFVSIASPDSEYVAVLDKEGKPIYTSINSNKWGSREVFLGKKNWQEAVKEFLVKSDMIIVREGFSEGLKWELEQIWGLGLYSKCILYTHIGFEEKMLEDVAYEIFRLDICPFINLPLEKNGTLFYFFDNHGMPQSVTKLSDAPIYKNVLEKFKAVESEIKEENKTMQLKIDSPVLLILTLIVGLVAFILTEESIVMIIILTGYLLALFFHSYFSKSEIAADTNPGLPEIPAAKAEFFNDKDYTPFRKKPEHSKDIINQNIGTIAFAVFSFAIFCFSYFIYSIGQPLISLIILGLYIFMIIFQNIRSGLKGKKSK